MERPASLVFAPPARRGGPPAPALPPRPYLAAPAFDSWRRGRCLPGTSSAATRLVSAQPASPRSGRPRRGLGLRRDPFLCTRVSRVTDRNRNAAVSRQRPVPGVTSRPRCRGGPRWAAAPGRPTPGEPCLQGFPGESASSDRGAGPAPSSVTTRQGCGWYGRPRGGQTRPRPAGRLECGTGRGRARREPPRTGGVWFKCGETREQRWSCLSFDGQEKSHVTVYNLINTLLLMQP